jgi:glycosyltransferase involved in cell wall biosynthesis
VPDVGLVHDYMLVRRGAERSFLAMADCWPGAPVHTLLYDPEVFADAMEGRTVRVSPLNRFGVRQDGFRRLLPLYPPAVERLDVSAHDIVVSSSSAFAHGVRPRPGAVHVCYCYTPFRYIWHERDRALSELPTLVRPLAGRYFARQRVWDRTASERVTHYIAISELTRARIAECYGRDSTIVHPPVEVDRFRIGEPEDFFLTVCELVPHKRVDVALSAARLIGARVKVVGTGPDMAHLQSQFGDTADFVGRIDDEELAALYARARALLVPNVEEFGIAAVEAQAAGRPVIATDAGGVRETVLSGETGLLVDPPTPERFAEAMQALDQNRVDPQKIRAHAHSFSVMSFQQKLIAEVARVTAAAGR